MKPRLLFCLTSNNISGANRILLELAHRAELSGCKTEVFFWNPIKGQDWFPKKINLCAETDLQKAVIGDFDFILFSNAFLLPLAMPSMKSATPVLVCQGYEGYCHTKSFAEVFNGNDTIAKIYRLPIAKISISKSVQQILATTLATDSYYVPPAIDDRIFEAMPRREFSSTPKRILAVGDYLWPLKGMSDLRAALQSMSSKIPVELVLLTQQKRARELFKDCSFPVEFHCGTAQNELAAIYASCHAYCCASWYEGFGLPCLEAFSVGVPVVCTANKGVSDFGLDGENLLIAAPNDPESLRKQLERVLLDENLADKLRANGRKTLDRYNWDETMRAFEQCLEAYKRSEPVVVSKNELAGLSAELEAAGLYTPLAKHKALVEMIRLHADDPSSC
jgi:glycosyltransferase involved in cell wall biosynthesis